jgi:hypothetical protein
MKHAWTAQQLQGAVTGAQNSGRTLAFADGEAAGANVEHYEASEILDSNTCDPCAEIDGASYESLADAEQDYPAGGYIDCDGGPNCRGTLVAVYDEQNPMSSSDSFTQGLGGDAIPGLEVPAVPEGLGGIGDIPIVELGQPEALAEPVAMYEQAAIDKPAFDGILASVGSTVGAEVKTAPLKGIERASAKAEIKYANRGGWARVQDVLRGTLIVPDAAALDATIASIRTQAEAAGWKVADGRSLFANQVAGLAHEAPGALGYRDASLHLESPAGLKTELQINTQALIEAKSGEGHAIYGAVRPILEKPAAEQTAAEQQQLDDAIARSRALYDAAGAAPAPGPT